MIILSHRGYWRDPKEKNTLEALKVSLENGFGFESDLRDFCGKMVISHDLADEDSPDAQGVFELLHMYSDKYMFAINIKADGLKDILLSMLEKYNLRNYFCFDMSIPQMIEFSDVGLRFFTRQSEYEPGPPIMLKQAVGVWLDAFKDYSWITPKLIEYYFDMGKQVCIVSPDLHYEPHEDFWEMLLNCGVDLSQLILCTDLPREAALYFGDGRL